MKKQTDVNETWIRLLELEKKSGLHIGYLMASVEKLEKDVKALLEKYPTNSKSEF